MTKNPRQPLRDRWKRRSAPHGPRHARPAIPLSDRGDDRLRLWGLHAVEAALLNPKRPIYRVVATENAAHKLAPLLKARGLTHDSASPRDLDRLLGGEAVHQGVMIETGPLPEPDFASLAAAARSRGPLIVLDQVTDPHNVGAILRSAAAFGAAGLVMTRRNSPPLDAALAKSASGALELVPVALVQNLARALSVLRSEGVSLLGLDGAAEAALEDQNFREPVAIVLGAEGRGLRPLTAQSCDRLVRITTADALRSLNVSNAAAIALHTALFVRKIGS